MKTYNRTEAIARMNALAGDNVPFLFIVDYAQEQSHVEPLDQINPATCLFQFPKAGNVGVAATAAPIRRSYSVGHHSPFPRRIQTLV